MLGLWDLSRESTEVKGQRDFVLSVPLRSKRLQGAVALTRMDVHST